MSAWSKIAYASGEGVGGTVDVEVAADERQRFCLDDADMLQLCDCALRIKEHYSRRAGHSMPMDIEWAKDGVDGDLYVVLYTPECAADGRIVRWFFTPRTP